MKRAIKCLVLTALIPVLAWSSPASVAGATMLTEIVHRLLLEFEDLELEIAVETALSGVSLTGKTAKIILTDTLFLTSCLNGGFLNLNGLGSLPEIRHPSATGAQAPSPTHHRFFGYPDEIIAVIAPSGGLIVKLLRPARTSEECLEAAAALASAVGGRLPILCAAPEAGIRLRITDTGALRRDSFLLSILFETPPLPTPFEGFDRIWIGLNSEESEARLTRLESPYARLILTTGPARTRERAFFTRAPNSIDLQRIDSDRRLNLLIESDRGLSVSEAQASAWIDLLTGRSASARP